MTDPRLTDPALDHAAHDLLLVAEAADRDGRLPASLAACAECQALHTDLVALAAAVPTAALPARPRDYALTEADAARLRPAGWRRWLAAIGTSRDAVTRPLAVGLTTIGLAGLLVATIPGALSSGASTAGAAPEQSAAGEAAGAPAAAAPSTVAAAAASAAPALPAPAQPVPAAGAATTEALEFGKGTEAPISEADGVFSGGDDTNATTSTAGARQDAPTDTATTDRLAAIRDDASGVSVLFVVAGALLIVGLGLFGLRWSARRG